MDCHVVKISQALIKSPLSEKVVYELFELKISCCSVCQCKIHKSVFKQAEMHLFYLV